MIKKMRYKDMSVRDKGVNFEKFSCLHTSPSMLELGYKYCI